MVVKLSDYILEQSISDAEVSDIGLEVSVSEIEVSSALLEFYIKQYDMSTRVFNESDDGSGNGFIQTLKKFFTSIANWFRKLWIRFLAYFSERRLNKILDKLEHMPKQDKKIFRGYSMMNKDSITEDIDMFVKMGKMFTDSIEDLANGNEDKYDEERLNEVLKELSELRSKNKKHNKNASYVYEYTYDDYYDLFKDLRDAYKDNRKTLDEIKESFSKNKYEKIIDTFNVTNEKEARKIYRDVKRLYDAYSSYSMTKLTMVMDSVKYGESHKKQLNKLSGVGASTESITVLLDLQSRLINHYKRLIDRFKESDIASRCKELAISQTALDDFVSDVNKTMSGVYNVFKERGIEPNKASIHQYDDINKHGEFTKEMREAMRHRVSLMVAKGVAEASRKLLTSILSSNNNIEITKDVDDLIDKICDTIGIKKKKGNFVGYRKYEFSNTVDYPNTVEFDVKTAGTKVYSNWKERLDEYIRKMRDYQTKVQDKLSDFMEIYERWEEDPNCKPIYENEKQRENVINYLGGTKEAEKRVDEMQKITKKNLAMGNEIRYNAIKYVRQIREVIDKAIASVNTEKAAQYHTSIDSFDKFEDKLNENICNGIIKCTQTMVERFWNLHFNQGYRFIDDLINTVGSVIEVKLDSREGSKMTLSDTHYTLILKLDIGKSKPINFTCTAHNAALRGPGKDYKQIQSEIDKAKSKVDQSTK